LTEIFFEDAIKAARKLDSDRKADMSKPLPALWGLPISVKDSFQIPGIDYSCGIASLVNEPSAEYSALTEMLTKLGAVLYTKTNVPRKCSVLAVPYGDSNYRVTH
jgi:amidase